MMAFPAPSWGSSSDVTSGGDTTDGIPVILQPIQTKDGRAAYLAIAPIPVEQEAQFISAAAKHDPNHTIISNEHVCLNIRRRPGCKLALICAARAKHLPPVSHSQDEAAGPLICVGPNPILVFSHLCNTSGCAR